MLRYLLITVLFFLAFNNNSQAQCGTLGQNAPTAFPVCGTTVFHQDQVPICSTASLFVPGCSGTDNADYENRNPFWYKFTCFQSGTLGFTITPNNSGDDYDWQLWDITGHNPDDIYTDHSLVVSGNWAGTYGSTGASASGVNFIQCASDPTDNLNSFARMPNLIQGHNYILLISHFTNSQSGYSLSFGGGTANITDPLDPKLATASAKCDGSSLTVKLNKKMKCNSLTNAGGSIEFYITPGTVNVTQAVGVGCSSSFDMDAVTLTLDNALPPGNYFVRIRNGADANTLLDNCDRTIPVGDSVPLTIFPLEPTPMDSLTKPTCTPQTLELVFRKPIRCNSISPDGSDFKITGTYPVTITGATGDCVDGVSSKIFIQLAAPLNLQGSFTISLVAGLDGNTIIDECGQVTPAGFPLPFSVKDTVSAKFTYSITKGCEKDIVQYHYPPGINGVNAWLWIFDSTGFSMQSNPQMTYSIFGDHTTILTVSNGFCRDRDTAIVFLDNAIKASFQPTMIICPNDEVVFTNTSTGILTNYAWDFHNGNTSSLQTPPSQTYPSQTNTYYVPIQLIVGNAIGCFDTTVVKINILNNCYIAVPSAFTPNGDGLNDYLYPLNAYKAINLHFSVYNRLGQLVFDTDNWANKWDGRFKGQEADLGTYVWILTYTQLDTNRRIEQKGTTVLIR